MKLKQIVLIGIALILNSCASMGYQTYQDEESKHSTFNCSGLHLKNATWEFTDQYNQHVRVVGKCIRGMRHGNFSFYIDGFRVAVTKYVRNEENYTTCYEGGQSYKVLEYCMKSYAEKEKGSTKESSQVKTQTTKSITVTTQTTKYKWD